MEGEMSIKGYVDSAEVDAKLGGNDDKAFVAKVFKGMKENTGKCPDLDIAVKTFAEAQKKVDKLNRLRYKMGSEYLKIAFVLTGKNDNDFNVYAKECEPAKKKNGKKKNESASKKSRKQQASAPMIPEQVVATAEAADKALMQVVNSGMLPPEVMSQMLTKNQEAAARMQQELGAQGTTEERKASLNKQIKDKQEIIDAIKKKLGQ